MIENTRILIIEDEADIRDAYQKILSPDGPGGILSESAELFNEDAQSSQPQRYDLTLAPTGNAGIEAVKTSVECGTPFAAAFVDMRMPGLDGAETIRRIWAIDGKIKVVIVTAYTDYKSENLLDLAGHGDLCFFRKPFSIDEITQLAEMLTTEWCQAREQEQQEKKPQ